MCLASRPRERKKKKNSLVLPHAYFKVRLSFDLSQSNDIYFTLFFNSWKPQRANTLTQTQVLCVFLFPKNKTYTVDLVLRSDSEFLEREVEESAQVIIQILDYTCEYSGNLLPNLECFGLFNTKSVKMNLCNNCCVLIHRG